MRDAFHQATIAEEYIGVVINHVMAGAVEMRRQHFLGQRKTHRVGQTLAQRAGGGLHSGGFACFRMAGGFRMQLTEMLQLIHRQIEAGQVQQRVLQHRAVAIGEHEAVTISPLRIGRVELQEIVPQHLGDVRHPHWHARVAGFGRFHGVHGKGAHGVGEFAAGCHAVFSERAAVKTAIVADRRIPVARDHLSPFGPDTSLDINLTLILYWSVLKPFRRHPI